MRTLALMLLLPACAAIPPSEPGSNNCGMRVGGDFDTRGPTDLTPEILADRLDAALNAASLTTDFHLMYAEDNCRRLVGYTVYTKPMYGWKDPYDRGFSVSGLTWCSSKTIVVGTPGDKNWNRSSLVHEIFHGMQNCQPPQPPDVGNDTDHANWIRDGIFDAIEGTKQ